jgi:hypothetical protein
VIDREIDEALERVARTPHQVPPALLERIAGSIKPSLAPVRPLRPTWMLAVGLFLICAAAAIAAAAHAGFAGIENMSLLDRVLIFPMLGILILATAATFVGEMIPGSRHRAAPHVLVAGTVALLALYAVLFRNYHTDHFLSAGIACLDAGLLLALPTALVGWLLLRRGFAVHAIAAGLMAGALGGLAGTTMLELRCPNFQALHVLVWHTAVVPLGAALGSVVAWALSRWRPAASAAHVANDPHRPRR